MCLSAFRSRRIYAPPPVSMCVSSPVAASFGPHDPQERAASFFTVTGSGPRRVAPGLQTNSVWPQSLSSSSPPPSPTADHGPHRSQDREMALAGAQSVLRQTEEDHTPSWGEGKGRGREIGTLKPNLIGLLLTWIKCWHIYSDQ